jgi:hypothetical protein
VPPRVFQSSPKPFFADSSPQQQQQQQQPPVPYAATLSPPLTPQAVDSVINLAFPESKATSPTSASPSPHSHTMALFRIGIALTIVLLFVLSIAETSIYRCPVGLQEGGKGGVGAACALAHSLPLKRCKQEYI